MAHDTCSNPFPLVSEFRDISFVVFSLVSMCWSKEQVLLAARELEFTTVDVLSFTDLSDQLPNFPVSESNFP